MAQLDLPDFTASDAQGVTTASGREGVFLKPVEAALLRPIRGRCTLLTRRGFNSLLLNAQRTQPSKDGYFSMPLIQLVNEHGSHTRNIEATKHLVANMLATVVAWGDSAAALSSQPGARWEACALLAYARIERTSAKRLVLTYDFHRELREKLLSPEVYYRLSLGTAANFRTHAALVVFEIATRYATNRGGLSARRPWREWAQMLCGSPQAAEQLQYKYFKRDTLAPAVRDVNQADVGLTVQLIEHTQGRRVLDLQLKVSRAERLPQLNSSHLAEDANLLARMTELGIAADEAEDLAQEYGLDELGTGCTILATRLQDSRLEPLARPYAFLKKVLQNRAATPSAAGRQQEVARSSAPSDEAAPLDDQAPSGSALRHAWSKHAQRIERARFDALVTEEKLAVLEAFQQSARWVELNSRDGAFRQAWHTLRATWPAQAFALHGYVSRHFFEWCAETRWPLPSDEDELRAGVQRLAQLALSTG